MRRFLEGLLVLALLLAVLGALHRGAVFGGGLLAPFDILGTFEPWKTALDAGRPANPALSDQVTLHPWTPLAAKRLIHDFTMTLWNPYQGCGTPLHANTLSAQLYPLMWLHALLPRPLALLAIGLARGLLTGFFFWLLLRRRGVSPLASVIGALALPLSGFYSLWLGHQQTIVASLLPLLLWLTDRAVDRPSGVRLALVGLVSGSTLLAGHLETALHVLLISTFYGAFRCLAFRESFGARLWRLAKLAGGFLVGAAISMAQILPFLEYSLHSAILPIRHHELYRFHNAWRDLAQHEIAPAARSIVAAIAAIYLTGRLAAAIRDRAPTRSILCFVAALGVATYAYYQAFSLGLLDQLDLWLDPDRHGSPLAGRGNGLYVGYLLYLEMNCGFASLAALPLAIAGLALRPKGDLGTLFLGAMLCVSFAIIFEWPLVCHLISQTPIFAEAKNKRLLLASSFAILWLACKGIDHLRAAARERDTRPMIATILACVVAFGAPALGRAIANPQSPIGLPGPPRVDPTATAVFEAAQSRLARGEFVAHVEDLLPERAREGPTLEFTGYAWLPKSVTSLAISLVNSSGATEFPITLDVPSAEIASFRAPPEHRAVSIRARADFGDAATGRYLVDVIAKDDSGARVGSSSCGAFYLARAETRAKRIALAGATLLLLMLGARFARSFVALALGGLIVVDLFFFADGFNPAVDPKWDYPTTPALEFLQSRAEKEHPVRFASESHMIVPANVATAYRLADTRNYDSIDIATYNAFLASFAKPAIEGSTRAALDANSPLFPLLAARFILAPKNAPPPAPDCTLAFDGEIRVYEHPRALPRAFVAPRVVTTDALVASLGGDPTNPTHRAASGEAFTRAAKSGAIDFNTTVVVSPEDRDRFGASDTLDPASPSPAPVAARFVVDDFDRIVVEAESPVDATLFLADTFLPGWVASIDGGEAMPCARANATFRAIPFPAGKHTVEFRYESSFVRAGKIAFYCGLAIAAVMILASLRRKNLSA